MSEPLLPPWLKYPSIPLGSMGWRMGQGEEYWFEFSDWFASLPLSECERFEKQYPEPDGWNGFYARKIANRKNRK